MRKLEDRSAKGKRLEKLFSIKLKEIFPSSETELKPRIINLKKDFWGLFDGITFIKSKKKYIFWQIKGRRLSLAEIKNFWEKAKKFKNPYIIIFLIEKTSQGWRFFYNNKNYFTQLKLIKKFLN